MGIEIASYDILTIGVRPFEWLLSGSLLILTLIAPIAIIAWRVKSSTTFGNPTWEFRVREIEIMEFESMMKDYAKAYSHFLSIIPLVQIAILFLLSAAALAFPFVLFIISPVLLIYAPSMFGIVLVLIGLVLARVINSIMPSEVGKHFPFTPSKPLRTSVNELDQVPGVSWAGIRVRIGEYMDYYTIRDCVPVARIEGIESVGSLVGTLDAHGNLTRVTSHLAVDIETDEGSSEIEYLDNPAPEGLLELVKRVLLEYVKSRGSNEILDDVLHELGIQEYTSDDSKEHVAKPEHSDDISDLEINE
ncbi:MAG: hypothetical protein ACW97A_12720 [Candidatus Thorarchaeota archaeon]|jgi:hypothetical protein